MASPFVELEVGTRVVKVTNPDKVLFPDAGHTKRDLVDYYLAVGDGIVRALRERPTQLRRFPDGIAGEQIYQKRVPEKRPEWVEVARVTFPSGRHADELCVTEVAQVVWGANLAVSTSIRGPRGAPTSTGRTSFASTSTRSRGRRSRTASVSPESCARCSPRSATRAGRRRPATAGSTSPCGSSPGGSSRSSVAARSPSRARSSAAHPTS